MLRSLLAGALALLLSPSAARADWHEASSRHFVVYANDHPQRLHQFATKLERFDKLLRFYMGVPDEPVGNANRVTVYVLDDTNDVEKLSGQRNVAGFYQARAGGSLAFVPRSSGGGVTDLSAEAVLQHEYTHHFLLSYRPNTAYSGWFIEGFAEFFATARTEASGNMILGSPPQYRGPGLLTGNWLPIDKLLTSDSMKLSDSQRDAMYGRGWLLTHYMMIKTRKERAGQLDAYFEALNQGKPPLEAAAVFGDLKALDRELERYKYTRFAVFRVPPERLPVGEIAIRKLGAGEAATMPARIRSKRGVNAKTAPAVYDLARKLAAPYPSDPAAQVVLAEAAYDARDLAGAEAAADRAIAADARTIDAHVYKAMARMAVAQTARDRTPATWSAIRRSISAANRIDPDDPEPLILFFRSFQGAGTPPTDNAKKGLYRAFQLAPHDPRLRFNTARLALYDKNPELARALLRPLAFNPHSRRFAETASKLIEQIDQRQAGTELPDDPDEAEDEEKPKDK